MNIRLFSAAIVSCLFCLVGQLSAQEFLRVDYTSTEGSIYYDVDVLNNGNYVCIGLQESTSSGTSNSNEIVVAIYSPTGQLVKKIQSPGPIDFGEGVVATSDGGFAIAGRRTWSGTPIVGDFIFVRYNATGDELWRQTFTGQTGIPNAAYDIKQLPDGGFILAGAIFVNQPSINNIYVVRTDAQGNKIWDYENGLPNLGELAQNIVLDKDGGYLITGRADSTYGNIFKGFALKLDANGNSEWFKTFDGFSPVATAVAIQKNNGEYLMLKQPNTGRPSILTLDSLGNLIATKQYNDATSGSRFFMDIKLTSDSLYYITGSKAIGGINRLWLLKLDEQLDTIWSKTYGDSIPSTSNRGQSMFQTADKGFVIAGRWGLYNGVVLKTDSLGNISNSVITGVLVNDVNANCTKDVGENLMPNNVVQVITNSGDRFYGYSNAQGVYQATVYDTGQATITWINQSSYWQRPACQPGAITVALQPNDTSIVDLYAEPIIFCPILTVEMSNTILRRCFGNNRYYVTYCNLGTVPANNAYVDVTFDQFLEVDNSSLPWTSVNGDTYRFDLGNIAEGACGSFVVSVTVNCDSAVLGQTHCVEARIYPDSICEPIEPSWDFSSLELVSQCLEGDSIEFTITNIGVANMSGPSTYALVQNSTVVAQVAFQLNAGESLVVLLPGNGSTYTMIVPQSAGHPGHSAPLRVVEGCGKDNQGNFEIAFTMQFPQDDENEFVDILCKRNQGSYDPNLKTPEPQGFGTDGFVNATQQLSYTIQFQNTGTDTAFTVVLRDTLPSSLDITTLRLTGASHPYTFQIIGSNVLEWTFPNILLPDSNVNEPLSHGFAAFKIEQLGGNTPGTEIRNRAGIYFDFNAPIITNTTLNTVVDDYKTLFTYLFIPSVEDKLQLGLYPNPNHGTFSLDFEARQNAAYEFVIYDLAGAKQFGQSLTGNTPHTLQPDLPTGMYLYQLVENGKTVAMGKVAVGR